MQPDENQNQTAEAKTNSQVTQSASPDTAQISPTLNPNMQAPKSKKKLTILIAVLIVVIAGAIVTALLVHNHKKTNTTSNNTANHAVTTTQPSTTAVTPTATDTWTGGGANSNWSDASNWSNGIPKTNYSLVFNLAPNTSSGQITSNNDLSDLSLNSITFQGGTPKAHGVENISLSGNPISLSNGIIAKTEADVNSSIAFGVTLTSNQTFNLNGDFGFVPVSSSNLASTNLNLKSYTLTITGTNGISFNYLSGRGTLFVNPTKGKGNTAVIGVGQPSPNFSGTVKVMAGLVAIDYGNSLGTATVDVNSGGTLRIVSDSTSSPVSNNLNLAGKGNVDSRGNYFGAINIVGSNQNVTLSGKITLSNNTQLGIYNATSNNPGDGTGTFTLSQAPALNGYTLTGLTSNTKVVTQ